MQYKQQTRLDEKRKKALDLHLNFIVDQTEKYSSWLSEGLKKGSNSGSVGSRGTTPDHSGDEDFSPEGNDEDDEETIDREEKEAGSDEVRAVTLSRGVTPDNSRDEDDEETIDREEKEAGSDEVRAVTLSRGITPDNLRDEDDKETIDREKEDEVNYLYKDSDTCNL